MAEGDRTPVHVDLLWVEFQLAYAVHTHRSESFIDLRPLSHEPSFFCFHAYLEQIYIVL
jgi:hypothetical protein